MDATAVKDRFHEYVPGFVTNPALLSRLSEPTPPAESMPLPQPSWALAKKSSNGESLPQIIAHRGFKVLFPENTMLAFREAIRAGTEAIETDIHLTKDHVAVLSHDGNLKRCFGKNETISKLDWDSLSLFRTIQAPHEPMPRLKDLLNELARPGLEDVWLLLDIKMDDDPDLMMSCIASTIASVPPSPKKPWNQRILLGVWAIKYLEPCATHLPSFSIAYVGFSTTYARFFLTTKTPNVAFNMLFWSLQMFLIGPRFIVDAHAQARAVYAWTVNDEQNMRWCIEHGLDGVITDNVNKFIGVMEAWKKGSREVNVSWTSYVFSVWVWMLTMTIGWWYRFHKEKTLRKKRAPDAQVIE